MIYKRILPGLESFPVSSRGAWVEGTGARTFVERWVEAGAVDLELGPTVRAVVDLGLFVEREDGLVVAILEAVERGLGLEVAILSGEDKPVVWLEVGVEAKEVVGDVEVAGDVERRVGRVVVVDEPTDAPLVGGF